MRCMASVFGARMACDIWLCLLSCSVHLLPLLMSEKLRTVPLPLRCRGKIPGIMPGQG